MRVNFNKRKHSEKIKITMITNDYITGSLWETLFSFSSDEMDCPYKLRGSSSGPQHNHLEKRE